VVLTESREEGLAILLGRIKGYAEFTMEIMFLVGIFFTIRNLLKKSSIESLGMPSGIGNNKSFKPQVNLETRFKDVAGLADAKV